MTRRSRCWRRWEAFPRFELETRFLTGFIAAETGDLDGAIKRYRKILDDDPKQTRVRLELARAYLMQGKTARADHHFKLAQADQTLPPDIARMIRSARNIIRSKRAWTFNVDIGIAPDTNINNATDANGVTLYFGDTPTRLYLDEAAKARSGTGLTGLVSSRTAPAGGEADRDADRSRSATAPITTAATSTIIPPRWRLGRNSAVGQGQRFGPGGGRAALVWRADLASRQIGSRSRACRRR